MSTTLTEHIVDPPPERADTSERVGSAATLPDRRRVDVVTGEDGPVPATVSGALVGRDAELASLLDAAGVGSGTGVDASGHVLLSGDAGVGKTRLLLALRDAALADGWQVVAGHCLDFGDSPPPYLPFSEILGRLAVDQPGLVDDVTAERPALARLQPGHRTRGDGDSLDRGELFDAVHTLLQAAAVETPLLVVVEDTHWADQSTRELVGFLFSRPYDARVSIIVSYRADDLHRRHPLRRNVAEWSRMRELTRLPLARLPDASVAALVAELVPDGVTPEELAAIVARAEGNAFFVEELVAAASAPGGGQGIPDDLADVLLVRLDRLDDAGRQVVRAASVAGRRVSHPLLAAVSGLDDAALDEGLRHAVESHILVVGDGTYTFRHALLGEAVYDDLLPGERVRLHGCYVRALLDRSGDGAVAGTAAELSRHAWAARDLDVALEAAVRAGEEAIAVGGPDEAVRHYEHALELLADPRRALATGGSVDRSRLVVSLSDALVASGRPGRAASVVAEQLALLPPDVDRHERTRLLATQAAVLYLTEAPDAEVLAVSREAVALSADDTGGLRATVLAVHARVLTRAGLFDDAESTGLDALALAERLDLNELASEIVTTLSSLKRAGPAESLREALGDAIERARVAGALQPELRARFMMGRSFEDWGEFEDAASWFRGGMERAAAAGTPWVPYGFESRWQLAWVRLVQGRWDQVLQLTDPGADPHPAVPGAMLDSLRLQVEQARGADPVRVEGETRGLRQWWGSEGAIAIHSASIEMLCAGARGDWSAAVTSYDDAAELLGRLWHPAFSARIRLAAVAIGVICRAVPRLPAAEREVAMAAVARLTDEALAVEPLANPLQEPSGHWGPEGRAWSRRLAAEALRARWLAGAVSDPVELVDAWRGVAASYEEFGDVLELARVRVVLAEVLRASGDAAGAREVADLALAAARGLGATPLVAELRGLAGPTRPDPAAVDALTPRETEILALVAEGRSNGEIGKRLFISTKTVSVHVSNILGKLGAAGRTEAAAIARRRGLLG